MDSKGIEVTLMSGLSGDTPIIIGDDLKNIRSLFIGVNAVYPTFGLNGNLVPIITEITSIPKEMYVNELWEVSFSNGVHLLCTPSTLIFELTGFKQVKDLKPKMSVLGAYFNTSTGEVKGALSEVVTSNRVFKSISEPMYYFISKDTNILIPHYNEEQNQINFVCVHQ